MKAALAAIALSLSLASSALALDFTNDGEKPVAVRVEPNDGSASTETVSAGSSVNLCDTCETCRITVKKKTVEAACSGGKVTFDGSKLTAE